MKGFPYGSLAGDRIYYETDWTDYFKDMFGTGVVGSVLNQFEVTSVPGELKANVDTGLSFLQGRLGLMSIAEQPAFSAPSSGTRYDRVVIKDDRVARVITCYVKTGDAVNPPSMTRDANTYEISLAKLTLVSTMTDLDSIGCLIESEIADPTVCGIINRLNQNKCDTLYNSTLPQLNGNFTGFSQAHGTTFGAISDGEDLYVFGGTSSNNFLSLFDTSAGSWSSKATMTTGRTYPNLTYYDGVIYAIGGYTGSSVASKKNEAYSISGNSHSAKADKTTATWWHGQTLLGTTIYCFGGITGGASSTKTSEKWVIDDASWGSVADLPSTPGTTYPVSACNNGTNIYVAYHDGAIKFTRYNVGTDSYTSLTAPSTIIYQLWYIEGHIFAMNSSSQLLRYDIATDKWFTVCTATGVAISSNCMATINDEYRFALPVASATNSKYYTYFYKLGDITYNAHLNIRARSNQLIQACNLTSLQAGSCVPLLLGDAYGIFINDITVNQTSHTLHLMA